ncbi:MAG: hypothetical protein ABL934_18380 [Lysobacteraceae bacterium]
MTLSTRTVALLATLLLAAAPAFADDTGQVRWPAGWKTGEVATYSTESIVRDRGKKGSSTRRTTDRTEIRTNEANGKGYVLTWVTRDSRIEAVEGDRSMVDAIAPILDELDGMEIVIELDRDGRYRRVRNMQTLIAKVRATMLPVFAANLSNMFDDDPKISKADRGSLIKIAQDNLEASIDDIITPASVETMSSEQAKTMTAFVGKTLTVGKRYRDTVPMDSPNEGRPLQANREYVLSLVDDDPNLARIRWTHTLDTVGNSQALWALVDELTSGAEKAGVRKARPSDLALRRDGIVLFRRDTGAVEMLETTEISRYGTAHDEHERYRMRRSGSARTWAQEDAVKP